MNFYQRLIDTLWSFWSDLIAGFIELFRWLDAFYKLHTWAMAVFVGLLWYAVTYATDAVVWIGQRTPALITALTTGGGLTGQGTQIPSPLEVGFSIINAFVPLTELIGFFVFIMPFWLVAVTIRSIKAWIPTVS